MPEQIWDALKWLLIMGGACGYVILLMKWFYKFFVEEEGNK